MSGWLSNICIACGHVGDDAQSLAFQALAHQPGGEQARLWPKTERHLVPHFFFPVKVKVTDTRLI